MPLKRRGVLQDGRTAQVMKKIGLDDAIHGEFGYSTALTLTDEELAFLRQAIRVQWLYRLQLLTPQNLKEFDALGVDRYHTISHLIDHSKAWPKTARVFPREVVARLREMPFFQQLAADFGPFKLSDEENFGWENVYWRLVRPGNTDIGPIHSDKWFWDLGHGRMPDYPCERVKVWIGIYTAPGKNGLLVIPGSHRRDDWKWHEEERFGMRKPVFDEKPEELDVRLLELKPGQAVVFHDKLLHGGAANQADSCRVSMEFTLFSRK
ncbi:MAG: phytanoyl-CoA dioxygenase family protein [Verrucomicrobiota bacterium]